MMMFQILVSFAFIVRFGPNPQGLSLWTRLIASLMAAAGLVGGLVPVIANLPLLAGSDSLIIWSVSRIVGAFGLIGTACAIVLRFRRPFLHAALGSAITEV